MSAFARSVGNSIAASNEPHTSPRYTGNGITCVLPSAPLPPPPPGVHAPSMTVAVCSGAQLAVWVMRRVTRRCDQGLARDMGNLPGKTMAIL